MTTATRTARKRPTSAATKRASQGSRFSVLTAKSFCGAHEVLTGNLRKAGLRLETAASWEKLLLAPDDEVYDAVLVDMDAVERSCRNKRLTISGHRFVSLLAKHFATKPTALIVLTCLDFAEVEDLARVGVHAFLAPDAAPHHCAEHIRAAIERVQAHRSRRTSLALDTATGVLPIPASNVEPTLTITH